MISACGLVLFFRAVELPQVCSDPWFSIHVCVGRMGELTGILLKIHSSLEPFPLEAPLMNGELVGTLWVGHLNGWLPCKALRAGKEAGLGTTFLPTRSFTHPQMPKQGSLYFSEASADRLGRNSFSFSFSLCLCRVAGVTSSPAFLTGQYTPEASSPRQVISFLRMKLCVLFPATLSPTSTAPTGGVKKREVYCSGGSLKINNSYDCFIHPSYSVCFPWAKRFSASTFKEIFS